MAEQDRDRFVALAFCRADLLFELNEDLDIVFTAGASEVLLGETADALEHRPFLDLVIEEDRTLTREFLNAALGMGRLEDVTVHLRGADGRQPSVILAGYRVPDFDDHFFLALKVEPLLLTRPREEPPRDQESGLLTESGFSALAAERALAFKRAGGRPQLTMVKIANFDELTATLGTSERKEVMTAIGGILEQHSLGGGTAGRIGKDDFSYVHRDDVEPEQVNSLIADAARKLFKNGETRPEARTLDADGAGLGADQVARAIAHTIRLFTSRQDLGRKKSIAQVLTTMVGETIDTVAYLRKAIANRDFDQVFQPVCDLRLERIHHFEVLTRFHEAYAATSPYHLFSLAEEVGIINELDLAVCETVIHRIAALVRKNGLMPPVAINLSGLSLSNPAFVENLRKLLRQSGVVPRKILFELTESAKIEKLAEVNAAIQSFRTLGFRFCLDDFGSGSASFDYLNALDVDIVKFDGPVIKRACASQKGSDMLASMARMCASMGVRTTAEMVEDRRTAARVYQCGVDFGQGWHFGRPHADPFSYAGRFAATP